MMIICTRTKEKDEDGTSKRGLGKAIETQTRDETRTITIERRTLGLPSAPSNPIPYDAGVMIEGRHKTQSRRAG